MEKYADLLPKISAVYADIERLQIDKLAQELLLTVASQFYDKTTISSFHDIHPLETRKKYHTLSTKGWYGSMPFEHRFFIGLAPPTAYLAAAHARQRLRLENALQSMEGASLRRQIIAELNQQREYHSAMVDQILTRLLP